MQVGVHKISVLSQLLFAIAVDATKKYPREGLTNGIWYADDLVSTSESTENI